MSLRLRLALTLALLAAVTAGGVAFAGFRVTSDRLNYEIDRSLSEFTVRLTDADAARRFCGIVPSFPGPGRRPSDGRRSGLADRMPSGITIQCLDRTGDVIFTGAGGSLPVDDEDVRVASGETETVRKQTIDVDNSRTEIRTVPVEGVGAIQVARSLQENTTVLESLLGRYLLLAAAAIVLAGLAGVLLAQRTAEPLARLTGAAERIANTGDLSLDLPNTPSRQDETGRLASAFVTMVDALRSSREQQARLVQDAGHELRTPLTSLRTNVSLLRRPDLPDDKRAEILDAVHHELIELTDLTNELVALAAESSATEPVQRVELDEVVERCVERCRRRTARVLDVRLTAVQVDGQPAALARAVDNLLGNANKFSPGGTSIDVHLSVEGERAVLRVRDRGPGIGAEDLPRVFERFYRATQARTLPGSGLGLAIVHDTVVAHGGTVDVQNAADGGAVFTLAIPVRSVQPHRGAL